MYNDQSNLRPRPLRTESYMPGASMKRLLHFYTQKGYIPLWGLLVDLVDASGILIFFKWGGYKYKYKYEGVLYNTASMRTLPSPVTAPHTVHRQ